MTNRSAGSPGRAPGPRSGSGGSAGRRPAKARRTGWRRFVPTWRWVLGGVLGALLLVIGVFLVGYASVQVPDPNKLAGAEASIVYFSDGKTEIGRFGAQNRVSVPLSQVPEHVQHAVLSAENRDFYTDNGISPTGIARAVWTNLTGGSTQGGSTITQQYVKNTYLTQNRTWKRKFEELFITLKVDKQLSKDEILAGYLNTIYFGRGAYGIETASKAYFHKDVSKLTVEEGAVLASLIRAPGLYDPAAGKDNAQRLLARYHYVLSGMVEEGWLPKTYNTDKKLPKIAPPSSTSRYGGTKGYLLAQTREELHGHDFSDQDIDFGGLRVITTYDAKMQAAAEKAMEDGFPTKNAKDVHAGLAAVEPGTGAVRAMYGGPDYLKRQFNDATDAAPQAGSTFKPFALAAALEKGISLKSRFDGNSPYDIPGDSKPVNNEFDRDYGAAVDLVQATVESINTAYVDLVATEVAPKSVLEAAVKAGIPKDAPGLKPNVRITLGTSSIHPIDMADAYATFAAQGEHAAWYTIQEVRDGGNDGLLYRAKPQPKRVFDKDVMADVTYALTQVIEDPSGSGTYAQRLDRPAAGKTGTAALRDNTTTSAWFAGYTPKLATAVAFYKGDGTENLDGTGGMSTFFGAGYPTQIWTAFMKGALAGTDPGSFPPRADVGSTVNPQPSSPPTPTDVTSTPTPSDTAPMTPTAPPTDQVTPSTTAPEPSQSTSGGILPTITVGPSGGGSSTPTPKPKPSSSPTGGSTGSTTTAARPRPAGTTAGSTAGSTSTPR